MPFDTRFLNEDDLEDAFRLDQQTFNLPEERREHWIRHAVPERRLGAFADGRMVGATAVHAFGQFFGGRPVPMGGVGDVAVVPEHRGKGLARRLLIESLQAMRNRGEVVSVLYPATTALYRSVGYELAGASVRYRVSASALRGLRGSGSLQTRRVEEGEEPAGIRGCYERVAPGINGWLDRDDRYWRSLWGRWRQQRFVYEYTAEGGQTDAYLVYRHEPPPPGVGGDFALRVEQIVAATSEGLRSVWRTLAASGPVVDAITFASTPEDALLLIMPEQHISVRGQVRWMLRIVDARGAVAARGYPPSLEIAVPIALEDEIFEENGGTWTLSVSGGRGHLEAGSEDGPRFGIGAFSSLYTGWASTQTLARTGLLTGGSPSQLRALDAAFAGPTPWMMDEF